MPLLHAVPIAACAGLAPGMPGPALSMSQRIFPREDLSQSSLSDLKKPVRAILKVVLLRFVPCIVLGFGALSAVFGPGVGWHEGLWLAPFHALSALNDAGFSLFADSLSA